VPLLEDNGQKIWESAIINEYLEDAYPQQPLWPAEPLLRAKGRLAVDWAGNRLIPGFYHVLRGEAEAADRLTAALQEMPQWMSAEGPFWLGPEATLADAAIYPWFERWLVLDHYRSYKPEFPARVQEWVETLRALPVVHGELGDREQYIHSYARYAQPPQTSKA
jgi:glutathione S-transferase